MSFTVTRLYDKYRILGGSKPVDAANLTEVKEALSHFYDERAEGRKGSHHFSRPKCPFCRLTEPA